MGPTMGLTAAQTATLTKAKPATQADRPTEAARAGEAEPRRPDPRVGLGGGSHRTGKAASHGTAPTADGAAAGKGAETGVGPVTALAATAADDAAHASGPQPSSGDTAPRFAGPLVSGAAGGADPSGVETLAPLPAQAATHYAAAAASGRPATAHNPAMAQLAAPLVHIAEAGGGSFHIDLAPAELGRVRVTADVSEGKVALTIQAEHADTLALLRRDLQRLERALDDSGLSLDTANLQFSLQDPTQDGGRSRGFSAPGQGGRDGSPGGWRALADTSAPPDPVLTADRIRRPSDGLVDVTV